MIGALKFRDFRLLWFGSLVSNIGEGMREVAEDWLVFVMTGSPFLLGVISFCKGTPRLILGPVLGVIVDRLDRKWIMIASQLFHLSLTLVYAVLLTAEVIEFWHIVVLTLIDSIVAPILRIARQTLIPDLVSRDSLLNALSLHSLGAHASHMIGPLVGGVLIVWLGIDGVFYIISLSFCAIVVSLLIMRIPKRSWKAEELKLGEEIREGLRFVRENRMVFNAMTMQFFSFLFVLPFTRFLPVYAKDILNIGATGLGLLRGCFAGGNVLGGLVLAYAGDMRRKQRLMVAASVVTTVSLILFSHVSLLPLSLGSLLLVGMSSMVFRVTGLSIIQLNVPDRFRGRVMGLYNLESGFRSLGGLIYGASASLVGTPLTVATGGAIFGFLNLARRYLERRQRRSR